MSKGLWCRRATQWRASSTGVSFRRIGVGWEIQRGTNLRRTPGVGGASAVPAVGGLPWDDCTREAALSRLGDKPNDDTTVVVRGGDLRPGRSSHADALRNYTIYGMLNISVFAVRDRDGLDELAQQPPLVRFERLVIHDGRCDPTAWPAPQAHRAKPTSLRRDVRRPG